MALPPADDTPDRSTPPRAGGSDPGFDPEATRLTQPPAGAESAPVPPPASSAPPSSTPPVSSVPVSSVMGASMPGGSGGEAPPIGPGTLLSHTYRVEGLIARGGMGEVHRARHVDMDTWHAVKVIRPELAQDAKMVELLRREAAALRDIRHEAVVSYDGVFRDEYGRLLLSMEFLDGPSLHAAIQAGPLAPDAVAILLDRVASGLAAAHQRGIVHRDMSTDNVILPGNRIADAKIIDFGIAKQTAAGAGTVIGDAFAGKYGYASPEQFGLFGGQVGPQSDIYSAGLVLAAAALGKPLDMGRSPQAMIERRMAVPDLSALDEPLRGVLCAMLEPDPQNRARTMAELVGALTSRAPEMSPFDMTSFPGAKIVVPTVERPGGTGIAAPKPPAADPVPPPVPTKKTPVGLIAGIGGAVVVAGVAGFLLLGQPASTPGPALVTTAPAAKEPATAAASQPSQPAPSQQATAPVATPAVAVAPPEPVRPDPTPTSTPTPTPPAPQTASIAAPPPAQPASPPVIPAALPVAPRPSALAEARKAVDSAASGLTCAGVRAVEDGDRLRIGGYVGSEDDAKALRSLIGGLPAAVQVDARVAVRPWPLCEALGAAGLPARAEAPGAHGPALAFNRPSMVYRKGDKLEVTVTPGAGLGADGGHLTVDYIDMEGNAIHMVPMPLRRDDRVSAGQPVTLGVARAPSDRVYTVSPPYGPAMILAVVTREPLFAADRKEVEPAAEYLPVLRAALARAEARGGVSVQSAFFTTVAE